MRTAIIFGVTGQDGSYLAELLLKKNYRVIGVSRRSSTDNTERLTEVLNNSNFTSSKRHRHCSFWARRKFF